MSEDDDRGSRLLRGILDACLLALIAEEDRYGYELAEALHDGGLPLVAEGSIYPLLTRMERRGALESYRVTTAGSRPRRYYRLTELGRRQLEDARGTWVEVARGVDALLHTEEVHP